uniref:DFDF domain-containing protein n=3 Tax=Anopheles coluzzii TaxID=1518534 RepID=A0A6E8W8F5_ANOCL
MNNARNIHGNRHQHHHAGPYRNDVEAMGGYMGGKRGGGGGGEKPPKANQPHKPPRSQASVEDSALELEVANIFDMDELDEEDLSDFNSGPSGHGDAKDTRYMANGGADGATGRSKGRPGSGHHQYDREMGRNGAHIEGRNNRFQNPHAKTKGGGNGRGFGPGGDDGAGGKQNQGYYDDRGTMY